MSDKFSGQQKIGYLIRRLREQQGITQKNFAKNLKTSQSAVARMEKGNQNFTTQQLTKISNILNHKIVSLSGKTDDFEITGGKKLKGIIQTNTSKNGALGLFCASLVNKATTTLHGVPRIEEIYRMCEILESIGVKIVWKNHNTVDITPPKKLTLKTLNKKPASKIRS